MCMRVYVRTHTYKESRIVAVTNKRNQYMAIGSLFSCCCCCCVVVDVIIVVVSFPLLLLFSSTGKAIYLEYPDFKITASTQWWIIKC